MSRRQTPPEGGPQSDRTLRDTRNQRREPLANRCRLLVVDDSAAVRSFIRAHLAPFGFELLDAEDGERALRIARLLPLDVVVADITMPGLDGIEFVRSLRASDERAQRELPVVLLTGDRSPELHRRGIDAGASKVLYKPVTSDSLLSAVNAALGRNQK
ncbi:MAG TPA: response regulator [Polyangiaceae bacterium]|jgi:two-component system chemotaxis response regulator CheY|nr:response regulator [Polyangiaceae bacterium]